jgi:hypothetical protein
MNVCDVVCIKNAKGILKIHLEKMLRLQEVMTGNGVDKLPKMDHPCLGFHQRGSEDIITLTDENEAEQFPMEIYIGFFDQSGIEVWKGRIDGPEEEDPVYTTIGP